MKRHHSPMRNEESTPAYLSIWLKKYAVHKVEINTVFIRLIEDSFCCLTTITVPLAAPV